MKRLIAPLVLGAVALTPGVAQAKAKVYKGSFQYVGADGDYVTGSFGKVQLVDGRRNDKLSVHVRRLAGTARYVFRLQQAPIACEEDAPGGAPVAGWTYRRGGVLKTNRKGVANGSARSRTFTASRTVEYFVGVYRATATGDTGELVLCAKLNTKKAKAKKSKPKHGNAPAKSGDGAPAKDDDDAPAKTEDTAPPKTGDGAPGKIEDAPGHKQDKVRGKSEDAPGHNKDKDKGGKPRH